MIKTLKKHLTNLPGWRTNRKIIVFESDDWGMIRTSSKKALEYLSKKYPLNNCGYSRFDALERQSDLQGLLDVLASNSNSAEEDGQPKFTLNFVTNNPDFDKIEKSKFKEYHRESSFITYKEYENSLSVPYLMNEGIKNGLVLPQFHATEHININTWMKELQNNNKATREAFVIKIANLHKQTQSNCHKEHLDAFGYREEERFEKLEETVNAGLKEFESIFKFKSKTMIAPCYLWDKRLEKAAITMGIKAFQGGTVQKIPTHDGFRKKRHFMGQKGSDNQRYFIRNCQFERVGNPNKDWVSSCLKDIEIAFKFNKPAIISSHRVNYIGRLNEANRTQGLRQLDQLLKEINKKWPDVQYLSTPELLNKFYE